VAVDVTVVVVLAGFTVLVAVIVGYGSCCTNVVWMRTVGLKSPYVVIIARAVTTTIVGSVAVATNVIVVVALVDEKDVEVEVITVETLNELVVPRTVTVTGGIVLVPGAKVLMTVDIGKDVVVIVVTGNGFN
jgi:hypothetical protein